MCWNYSIIVPIIVWLDSVASKTLQYISKSDKFHYEPQVLWLFISICAATQSKYPDDSEVWLYSVLETISSGCITQNCDEKQTCEYAFV